MNILERLQRTTPADDGRDLAEVLGVKPEQLRLHKGGLEVNGEVIPYAALRLAVQGGAIETEAAPRTVTVRDL